VWKHCADYIIILRARYIVISRIVISLFLHFTSLGRDYRLPIIVARASQNRIREKLPELARGHDENHSHSVRGRLSRIDTISRSNYHSSIPSLLSLITRPCSPMIVIRCKRSFRYAPSLRRGFSSFNAHR
jgi:hypothetical protein